MLKKASLFLSVFYLSACTSIPPEAPELSIELGKRVTSIESANLTLLHRFFDQKRVEIDRFIEQEWLPEFSENFFNKEKTNKVWNEVVKSQDKKDRIKFILIAGPAIQNQINSKRSELVGEIDALEREVQRKIEAEYNQVRSINNVLTSFLTSAAEVTENRSRYMNMIGINEIKVEKLINDTDQIVNKLLDTSTDTDDKVMKAKIFKDKIQKLRAEVINWNTKEK
ncbi:hypothetical protein [Pseudoalteromonas sp. SK18]|uniref:hypothetical protein n=1 Tax=Pseudoalteromonas sp. SK18 TaxID=1938366 RepID=UPI000977BB51|nr:hypothetical protein [Pseudoalteromonas sp. SK18]